MSTTSHAAAYGFVEKLAQDLQDSKFELPAFPDAVLRIQRALQSPETNAADIVDIMASDPALAARMLQLANSPAFRAATGEITDLRAAVSRLGFNMVRTAAVEFAMRQLRRTDVTSEAAKSEIRTIWHDSLQVAAVCYVVAKHYTNVNPDQALLTGLLHALGRLYVVMRAEGGPKVSAEELREVAASWQATIGKAILESWGLPEALQHAVEHQDDVAADNLAATDGDGAACLTRVLIAAKLLATGHKADEVAGMPALAWLEALNEDGATAVLENHAEEIQALHASLGE